MSAVPKKLGHHRRRMSPGSSVLGEGGFGKVVTNVRLPGIAHKLLKSSVSCSEAATEYAAHKRIYAVFREFMAAHPSLNTRVAVPAPHQFTQCPQACNMGKCRPCGPPYHCMYSMKKVVSGRPDGVAVHVLLNRDYPQAEGKLVFVEDVPSMPHTTRLNASMREAGRPRGAFLGIPQLEAAGFEPVRLAYHMGILFEIIVVAGLVPMDVEYVLGMPPGSRARPSMRAAGCLWAMDFGMVHDRKNFDPEMDMYIPHADTTPELVPAFKEGRALVRAWAGWHKRKYSLS